MSDRLAELQELQDRLNALIAAEGGSTATDAVVHQNAESEPEQTDEQRNAQAAESLVRHLAEVASGNWLSVRA